MDVNAQQNNQNIIINGYKLIRPINSGNFGNVLLMEKDGHRYAVKQIKEIPKGSTYEKRLQREAIIPLNLNHENLIYYYGSFVENNTTYLVLEY
jgi:serine/threonine protein kinase